MTEMSSCVRKISFKSVQVCGYCCRKNIYGLTFWTQCISIQIHLRIGLYSLHSLLKIQPHVEHLVAHCTTWRTHRWFIFTLIVICSSETTVKILGGPKNLAPFFLYALTLPNRPVNRFSKLFHCQNPDVSVMKATIENKITSVTTHFKKWRTGNNVFLVLVYCLK